jgi:hypothetical protein
VRPGDSFSNSIYRPRQPAALNIVDVSLDVPCANESWKATSAEDWHHHGVTATSSGTCLRSAVRDLLSGDMRQVALGGFIASSILYALLFTGKGIRVDEMSIRKSVEDFTTIQLRLLTTRFPAAFDGELAKAQQRDGFIVALWGWHHCLTNLKGGWNSEMPGDAEVLLFYHLGVIAIINVNIQVLRTAAGERRVGCETIEPWQQVKAKEQLKEQLSQTTVGTFGSWHAVQMLWVRALIS